MRITITSVTASPNRTTVPDVPTPFGDLVIGDFVEYGDDSNLKYSDDTDVEYQ